MKLAEITAERIRAFLAFECERNSSSTAAHSFTALSAFFNHCVAEGLLEANPMANVKKPKRKVCVIPGSVQTIGDLREQSYGLARIC